jgi:PadR family transcriptional regulator AphA
MVYGLKKAFDCSVQHFWTANRSWIYRELAVLHEEGLLHPQGILIAGKSRRTVFRAEEGDAHEKADS